MNRLIPSYLQKYTRRTFALNRCNLNHNTTGKLKVIRQKSSAATKRKKKMNETKHKKQKMKYTIKASKVVDSR